MTDIRERILEVFLSGREERDAPYDEKNFLEFLVFPSGKDLRNTFRGAGRFGRFMGRIEDEFGICFPLSVMEKKWDLPEFISYVEKRRQKPHASLRVAIHSLQEEKHFYQLHLFLITLFVTLPAIIFALQVMFHSMAIGLVILTVPIGVNFFHSRSRLGEIARLSRMIENLNAEISAKKSASKGRKRLDCE